MFVEICKPTLFTFGLPLYWFLSLNYRWVEYETGQYRSVDSNQSLVTGFKTTAGISGSSTMSSAVKYIKIKQSGDKDLSPRGQLTKYLQQERDVAKPIDAASFWMDGGVGKDKYPALHSLALKALSVPASSAPVERIFSRGGIILRPHRARLGCQMVETLMFLKCNEHVL